MPKPLLTVRKGAFLFPKKPEVTILKFARMPFVLKIDYSKCCLAWVCLMI